MKRIKQTAEFLNLMIPSMKPLKKGMFTCQIKSNSKRLSKVLNLNNCCCVS